MLNYHFDWALLLRPQFLELIAAGIGLTVALAVLSGALSFVLGAALAVARISPWAVPRLAAAALVEVVRNVPALFWVLFFYFVLPELLPSAAGAVLHGWAGYAFLAGVLGLAVDNGAYLSDALRNGMAKVGPGQRDAAASCGLSFWQECVHILGPQSLRAMLPAIANRMVHNFKNTSLCIAIALPELTWATQQVESITFKGLEVTALATAIYAFGSLGIGYAFARLQWRRPVPVSSANTPAAEGHGHG